MAYSHAAQLQSSLFLHVCMLSAAGRCSCLKQLPSTFEPNQHLCTAPSDPLLKRKVSDRVNYPFRSVERDPPARFLAASVAREFRCSWEALPPARGQHLAKHHDSDGGARPWQISMAPDYRCDWFESESPDYTPLVDLPLA
eukprot:6173571-Pleurochrysis_carterae.AAC.1